MSHFPHLLRRLVNICWARSKIRELEALRLSLRLSFDLQNPAVGPETQPFSPAFSTPTPPTPFFSSFPHPPALEATAKAPSFSICGVAHLLWSRSRMNSFLGNAVTPRIFQRSSSQLNKPEQRLPPLTCWSCGAVRQQSDMFFCQSCGRIQQLDSSTDYYAIFQLPWKFDIDTDALEDTYKSLQKVLHPDMYATTSKEEQENSAVQSAHVIQAYYTLKQPLSRAKYLLRLLGLDMLKNDEGTIADQELLMEMMDVREAVEEAKSTEVLEALNQENNLKLQKCLENLKEAFDKLDLKTAQKWTQRLSYLERVASEIKEKQ